VNQPDLYGRPLTPREEEVITKVMEAKYNKVIAYEMGIAEGSVKEYLNRIFRKLGLTNRTELAVWAKRRQERQGG
jgi:DNA-binding NarL/FixJ family response regulator